MEKRVAEIRTKLIIIIAVILVLFHLYTALFGLLEAISQRNIHLTAALLLVILYKPSKFRGAMIIDGLLVGLTLAAGIYMSIQAPTLAFRAGTVYQADIIVGLMTMFLILEGTRRIMGWAMPIVALVMLVYTFFGQYLPQPFGHAAYSLERIISLQVLATEGIYGTPLGASASFIVLFIVFGSFLEVSGGGQFFMDLATGAFGWLRGGPAKVAVISSMLFGSISGSAVANVTTTGTFTIPLMKRTGYSATFAGAVEATASTGGQLMPPVMGAGAFLMAEVLGMPYSKIIIAAIIPGILYFLGCFFVVDLEAAKNGLAGLKRESLPKVSKVMRDGWPQIIPLLVLIYMLVFMRTSAMKAALWSIIVTIIINSILKQKDRMGIKKLLNGCEGAANGTITVAMATACAGIIIGAFGITGLGSKLSSLILMIAGGNVFFILVLTAICSIILGMGLPTVAAYIVLAVLVAPALISFGVDRLSAHMFIFYFGIISNVTPPVALAAYAAAGISGASAISTGWVATKLAIAGFLIPFVMVYEPAILMNGSLGNILFTSGTALLGIYSLAGSTTGFVFCKCPVWERLALAAAGIALVIPAVLVSIIGFIVFAIVFFINYSRARKVRNTQTVIVE